MSEELKEIPQAGSVIRFGPWKGVILDVFKSDTSEKHIMQIMFAKNIYKQQPAELHVYEYLKSALLLPSSREALMEELKRLNENALAEADKLLAKTATSVEIPVLAPREQLPTLSNSNLIQNKAPVFWIEPLETDTNEKALL